VTDGWCAISGTSAAAPQAAGAAAVVLEHYATHAGLKLSPMAVRNILENSARDVTSGSSSTGEGARAGWDPATGFGLINVQAARAYLRPGAFCPFIRDAIADSGAEPGPGGRSSPDIILLREPVPDGARQAQLGQIVKHADPSTSRRGDPACHVYLRVQNRGTLVGDVQAHVYVATAGGPDTGQPWREGGTLGIAALQPGELRVVGPIALRGQDVPAMHWVLAVLESAAAPLPIVLGCQTQAELEAMVRAHSTVAVKEL
jgi:hypothetical protein